VSWPASWREAAHLIGSAALVAALCGAPARVQGQLLQAEGGQIIIDADSLSYDKDLDTMSAYGDVVVRRGDSVLRADEVLLNRKSNEAQATGNTQLTSPDAEIHAATMFLDLDTETGQLSDAQIYSERLGYTLSGDRIEKRAGQSYRIENGRFTTCLCVDGKPTWSIAGRSLDVALDGYGYVEHGQMEILGWPVLWLPRFVFPAYAERQSGLLMPRVGFSNRRGFQLLQPYYWAINKSQDVTLSLDVETAVRIGLLGHYRYAFSETSAGEFQVGYFNESIRSQSPEVRVPPGINPVAPINRWGMIGHHTEDLGDTRLYGDLLLVGDNLFLREMNSFTANERNQLDLRTSTFTTSRLGGLQEWDRAFLQAEGIYYQDLIGPIVQQPNGTPNQNESLVIQRAPEIDLTAQKQLGFDLMGNFTGSVTNFQRGLGLTGFRADLRPEAELALPLGPSFYGGLRAAGRETAYALTENEMLNGFTGTVPAAGLINLPSTSSREIFELHSYLGTEFDRVYDFPYFGLDKLKHTIEPMVEYMYIPPVDQGDLPVFDGIDRINKRSLFTYGFASRLLGRSASGGDGTQGNVFEIARFTIAQSYDVLRDIPPPSQVTSVTGQPLTQTSGDHFSDIDFSLRVNPNDVTSLRAYATYDATQNEFTSTTIGIRLRQPERVFGREVRPRLLTRATLNVEYRFITNNILQLLDSSLALPITDRVAALYAMRYDINAGSFLENYVGMRLLSSCDCWSLNVGFTQTRNPNEVQLQAQFTLAGLGAITGNSLRDY
jgi:LPS-assembly protein